MSERDLINWPRVTEPSGEMVFILCSPRSGSTLLRVMLAGHSELFSPPELNLLPYCTMGERDITLGATANWLMGCDQRVGLNEAVMNLTGMDAEATSIWLQRWVDEDIPVERMYCMLRQLVAPRRLVDKAILNASCLQVLERSKRISPCAQYIHLIRHPYAVIESLQRMYLKGVPQEQAFQAAEALWEVLNRNILWFLNGIDPRRYQRVFFEDLVRDPERVMRRVCNFLRVGFEKEVLEPYQGKRMTEGSAGQFDSLGDPNFRDHQGIESKLGEAWKSFRATVRPSCLTRQLAAEFQYELP